MNLSDALLRDGLPGSILSISPGAGQPKVLKEIWIAIRNDGLPGARQLATVRKTQDSPAPTLGVPRVDLIHSSP
jgi:hypothetical protein